MARRLLPAILVVAALAGCGGSSSNGEAGKPAAQVVADAQKAALAATMVHVAGSGVDNNTPLKLDLWIGKGKGKGHLEEQGAGFDVIRIGNTIYVKGSDAFLKKFAGAQAAQLLSGKWLKSSVTAGQLAPLGPLTDMRQFFKSTLGRHGTVVNKGETTFQGQKAVEIRDTTQGGSLYVAAQGTPYPLGLKGGTQQGDVTFSGWNTSQSITAPPGALDLSKLGG